MRIEVELLEAGGGADRKRAPPFAPSRFTHALSLASSDARVLLRRRPEAQSASLSSQSRLPLRLREALPLVAQSGCALVTRQSALAASPTAGAVGWLTPVGAPSTRRLRFWNWRICMIQCEGLRKTTLRSGCSHAGRSAQ